MNKLSRILPAFALVLGATLAMAMNFANNPVERYAEDPGPGPEIWYDLTDVDPGDDTYDCDINISTICSRVAPMSSATQVEPGQFVVNGELPLADL